MQNYDVIVVGGGLAGLSAACECGPKTCVLVLEAEDRLGGKVCTENRNGVVYETGAIFAFDPRWFDFPIDAGLHDENNYPIGLFHRGHLYTGNSVMDCVHSLCPEIRPLLSLPFFIASPNPQEAMIGEDLAAAMRAFFHVIHLGTLTESVPARRQDCLVRHSAGRFQRGNGAMIDAMAAVCRGEIQRDCRVYGLEPQSEGVKVLWRNKNGAKEEAAARKVILATSATVAKALCGESGNVSRNFLGRVRYGRGIAVVLHCRAERRAENRRLSYLVSTQGNFNTFIFHFNPPAPDEVIVTGYIVGERAAACKNVNDVDLARMMIEELQGIELQGADAGVITQCSLLGSRVWPEVAPVIEESTYCGFSATWLHPMPGVILAGDYTWWDSALPYGMWPAIASGRRAARLCREPEVLPVVTDFGRMPLASTAVLRLDNGPEWTETFNDGTIAYYGLLLQAELSKKSQKLERLAELERYLLAEAVDDLWAYQQGYGVTSLDSFLVMEGLLATGRHEEPLRRSCRQLVRLFFDREEGGFWSLPIGSPGRAPYWQGVDCPATAACAWLLLRIDPQRYAEEIALCQDYLLHNQRISGGWPGKWFPSQSIPIWYALRFFTAVGRSSQLEVPIQQAAQRAAVRLRSGQGHDGSWGESIIETAAAVLALEAAHDATSLERGRRWLQGLNLHSSSSSSSSSFLSLGAGEPLLSYWFEEDGPNKNNKKRTFFFTRDRGQVSAAWATLALAGVNLAGVNENKAP